MDTAGQDTRSSKRSPGTPFSSCSAERNLLRWSEDRGAKSLLQPAAFDGCLRGMMPAGQAITAGDIVLDIPENLIISHASAAASDIGSAVASIPGVHPESISLIYTMVDRHDPDSPFAPFWVSLPPFLLTGLGAPHSMLDDLDGTPLSHQVARHREVIRKHYEDLRPVLDILLAAYPTLILPEHVDWPSFLWAIQLWYSYSIQVVFADGSPGDCLVPLASLMNHSPEAHVSKYGRLEDGRFRMRASRDCPAGEQCFISYGAKSNADLLIFYGMAIPNNPHDYLGLNIQLPDEDMDDSDLRQKVVEALHLTEDYNLSLAPLPHALLGFLRVCVGPSSALRAALGGQWNPLQGPFDVANEAAAMSQLLGLVMQLKPSIVAALELVSSRSTHAHDSEHRTCSRPTDECGKVDDLYSSFPEGCKDLVHSSLDYFQRSLLVYLQGQLDILQHVQGVSQV
eukprot:jgi/Botrbrau1/19040/Bobra.0100s0067.1